jgi:hypothetical protein
MHCVHSLHSIKIPVINSVQRKNQNKRMGPVALSPGVARYQHWFHLLLLMTILLPNELYSFSQPMYRSLSKNYHVNIVRRYERRRFLPISLSLSLSSVNSDLDVTTMKIQEIKAELQQRKVPINDVFEKDELIRRLQQARQNDKQQNESNIHSAQTINTENINVNHPNKNILSTPLYFTTMDQGMRVPAQNVNGGIIVEPSSQPYATMKIQIPSSKYMNSNAKKNVSDHDHHYILSLLVDTACTGLVLRPTVVRQYQLPSYDTPVTMQGAAGISQATGLTQLSSFTLYPNDNNNNHHYEPTTVPSSSTSSSRKQKPTRTFRSLPAAVQDINGLPTVLDGIIGLSFINQFAAMEFDFRQGMIHFYEDRSAIPDRRNNNNNVVVVVDTKLNMIGSLGIYTVPVYIGGRGPVQMLVDTGASCTLLNWKGVADLGLSQTSKQISRIAIPTGAMGSENVAIQLTHRLHVSSTFQMGDTKLNGIPVSPETRMPIDIGQIPVIDNIPGVGGILGIDALMRCRTLQISTRHPATLTIFV